MYTFKELPLHSFQISVILLHKRETYNNGNFSLKACLFDTKYKMTIFTIYKYLQFIIKLINNYNNMYKHIRAFFVADFQKLMQYKTFFHVHYSHNILRIIYIHFLHLFIFSILYIDIYI